MKAILGIYHLPALFTELGIKRYLIELARPDSLFGDCFIFCPIGIKDADLILLEDLELVVTKEEVLKSLEQAFSHSVIALQSSVFKARGKTDVPGVFVVSPVSNNEMVFQSCWYDMSGFLKLLQVAGFSCDEFEITFTPSGKGLTVIISSKRQLSKCMGLLTCLNNVIGCIYIEDQVKELQKILRLLKGEEPDVVFQKGSAGTVALIG